MFHATAPRRASRPAFVVAAIATAVLAACGGDGDSSSAGTAGGGATSTPASLRLSGVAATGAAMAGAAVKANCASGSGSATSGSDGSYALAIEGGALPCVLEASDGTHTLHSVAPAAEGSAATAHITPLTELLLAQLSGAAPAALFSAAAAGGDALAGVTTTALDSAQAAVKSTLAAAGMDTAALDNLLAGALTAGSGSGYDGVLDLLKATLARSGTSLPELAATVASASGKGPAGASGDNAASDNAAGSALPAELLLKPAAAGCASLRATDYWVVVSGRRGAGAIQRWQVQVDSANGRAASLVRYTSADSGVLSSQSEALTRLGDCHYSSGDDGQWVVSPAGVVSGFTAATEAFVAVPVQPHTLGDLVGSWNMLGSDVASFGYGVQTFGADGHAQFTQGCWFDSPSATACTDIPEIDKSFRRPITLRADGSYTEHSDDTRPEDEGPWQDRGFVYKNGKGDMLIVGANIATPDSDGDGSIFFATRSRTLNPPAVGSSSSGWNITTALNGLGANAISVSNHTVLSLGADGHYVRRSGEPGGPTHEQTLQQNAPYPGFVSRSMASGVPLSDGGTTNVRGALMLRAASTGLTVVLQPQAAANRPARLTVSVAKPAS